MPTADDIQGLFEKIRTGDRQAENLLVDRLYERIQRLVAAILRTYPVIRVRREVDSVAGDLFVKLLETIRHPRTPIESEEHFFRLIARAVRFMLMAETEKYRARSRMLAQRPLPEDGDSAAAEPDSCSPEAMEEWGRFWEHVSRLPEEEAKVFEMHYLLSFSQAEAARVLGWEPKQVSRKWAAASLKLADILPAVKG